MIIFNEEEITQHIANGQFVAAIAGLRGMRNPKVVAHGVEDTDIESVMIRLDACGFIRPKQLAVLLYQTGLISVESASVVDYK